jgi:hypothetical protein
LDWQKDRLIDDKKKLEAENKRLREALESIEHEYRYWAEEQRDAPVEELNWQAIGKEMGLRARKTLKEVGGE